MDAKNINSRFTFLVRNKPTRLRVVVCMKTSINTDTFDSADGQTQSDPLELETPKDIASPVAQFPELSGREVEVAIPLAYGKTSHEIAELLGISVKTVDTHRGNLLRKLGLRGNVQLAHYAITRGYIEAKSP